MRDEQNSRAARPQAAALLPAADCDLLTGRDQIAAWFGLTDGQCSARINDGSIVTFRLPGKSTIYASKFENMQFWRSAAEAHRARNGGGQHSSTG
jgi:hypothetical protein